jgi:diaminopimelate decarboxylase
VSIWREGIPPDELESVSTAALSGAWIEGADRSVVFHDLGRMRSRFRELARCFPSHSLHAVAIKANPLVEVLKEVVAEGAGLEAASFEEVRIGLAAGAAPERIVFDSPAKTRDELAQALSLGVVINADNFEELERIDALRSYTQSSSRIGLRINPMVGTGSIGITSVADGSSKFGVDIDAARQRILAAFRQYSWLRGLHAHIGSQGCDLDLLVAGAVRIQELVSEVEAISGGNRLDFIDIGGGLSAAYVDDDAPPGIDEYASLLEKKAPALFDGRVQLITEFGRALQAGCGFALSRVEYVKELEGKRLAVIHLGADMLMRPVYLPDQWKHRFLALDSSGKLKRGGRMPYIVAGPLCFAGDIVADGAPLPPIVPGDYIAVRDVGAYTMSMWSRHCSRAMPLVLGFDGQQPGICVLRHAETAKDVAEFWSLGHERSSLARTSPVESDDPTEVSSYRSHA